MKTIVCALFVMVLTLSGSATRSPERFGPAPSPQQRAWHEMEYYAFFHFNMNTFTDREWGYGDEPESLFNPTDFNAEKIASVVKEAGMKGIILTCKHHDGFCLWPSKYTEHSVKNSQWKGGKGDMVKEFADASRRHGLKFGIYLSPWDRNNKTYGKPEYITYFRNQLRELLTNYGEIFEVWFDGANGGDGYYGGSRESRIIDRKTYYGWQETWALVRQLQPNAAMFSDGGPDVRWVGDEEGFAGETNWSLLRRDEVYPGYENYKELISGHADGTHWVPAECDVSIRPGWFYHRTEDSLVKSSTQLYDLYFRSVGRNASLLLNVPPDRRGHIHENDVKALMGFKKMLDETFAHNVLDGASVTATEVRGNDPRFGAQNAIDERNDTYWATDDSVKTASLNVELKQPTEFNCIMLQEFIPLGQRVEAFSVDAWNNTAWQKVAEGTTIGYKRLLKIPTMKTTKLRLSILRSRACPTISNIGVYMVPETAATLRVK